MAEDIHEGHRKRIKDRFLKEGGMENFEDHQVLEMLLFFTTPRKDTNPLAHELIRSYGSLSAVLEADVKDLMKIKGVTENTAFMLSSIPSVIRAYSKDKLREKPALDNIPAIKEYTKSLFIGRFYEAFYVICLDIKKRVNFVALINSGTLDETSVYIRIILETALRHKADSVIFAHNHPGGSATPSMEDINLTNKATSALNAASISVADHIIVSEEYSYSFLENNMLSNRI